jgi:integrase/recombinase XerD
MSSEGLDADAISKIEEFKEECQRMGMTHGSILSYVSSLRIYLQFLQGRGKEASEVDKTVLKGYIDYCLNERKLSYKTLEYHFTSISAFYEWLVFEEEIPVNPIPAVRKRYLKRYKGGEGFTAGSRKLISVEEMGRLVNSILSARDRAIVLTLAKTGIRRGELLRIDLDDVDFKEMSIRLKPAAKRSNRLIFFDEETKRVLMDWIRMRKAYAGPDSVALFITETGRRVNKNDVYDVVVGYATRLGLHNPASTKIEDHFTPHCCRHWFTTHLRRSGMPREHIQELRGDSRPDAMDIYYHIDPEDLKKSYLAHIPNLGIK